MSRISYQGILGGPDPSRSGYATLGADAITTRRKDAKVRLKLDISKVQARWLEEVAELTGEGVDPGAVVRALIDLGMELDIDWPLVAGGRMLREEVRGSVLVRREEAG